MVPFEDTVVVVDTTVELFVDVEVP